MDIWESLMLGFSVALTLENVLMCFLGCILGTLIGVLPGVGPSAGVSILIPLTFGMSPVTALITMSGIYYGCMYGGSTTSILMNLPGEAASVITCLDGYQMARKGRAGPALGMCAISSFIAGTIGILLLTFLAPPLVAAALTFGSPEYFALTFMGLSLVTSLGGEELVKGLVSCALGLFMGCIGIDIMSGAARYTYGSIHLLDGIGFVNIAVGLFAVSEVLLNIENPEKGVFLKVKMTLKSLFPNLQDWKVSIGAILRGTGIGFAIGALPGAGPTIASFLSYAAEKKLSKHPEKFGTGVIEAVAGPEGANNAAAQAAYLPTLTLGIPGSGVAAILLGAFMIHGLRPGPMLMQTNPDFVWGLIASMYIGNVILVILNLPLIGIWVSVLRVPYQIIMPLIVSLSLVGIYSTELQVFDMKVTLFFGILGYFMRKMHYPLAPLVLAVILEPILEKSLKQSLIISSNSLAIFFTRPVSATLMAVGFLSLTAPLFSATWQRLRREKEEE